jgi:acyl carrier protein
VPTPAEVRAQLTDILAAVVDCPPERVRDDALLADLGVDSLAAVEVADELGRRFGVHLADDVVDGLATVADAVAAVVEHRPDRGRGRRTPLAPVSLASEGRPPRAPHDHDVRGRADAFWRLALWFVVAGVALGGLVGFAGATVVRATGLGGVDLPPISSPTSASPTPTASASPTPTQTTPTEQEQRPTFQVEQERVAPGERFRIFGRFPDLDDGEVLQVQVRDPGGDWDDFPVSVQTRDGGRFETTIYTSRTGEREFRVFHEDSGTASPEAEVTIG